ncbi:MAG: hypothetical protein JSV05_07120 [Candidatus Bathyarchaeota archaeon]|nr:MAG: hypothetical protein JSV05_07120 [Candidatus Bathyarchaeota archaeon]
MASGLHGLHKALVVFGGFLILVGIGCIIMFSLKILGHFNFEILSTELNVVMLMTFLIIGGLDIVTGILLRRR